MTASLLAPLEWPRWAQMWVLAAVIYAGCKWLSWLSWRQTAVREVPVWKHLAYLATWPGMDATTFLEKSSDSCNSREWLAATAKLACGAAILFGLARWIPPEYPYVVGWTGMIGIVMMLHFGAFHLLSCAWRSAGVQARPLMNRPLASTGLSEFWGRRWNTAFRDLTHRFLFRPCAAWFGTRLGVLVGFLFSGLIHDLVISVPARGGYGGPTVFFAIQGAAMLAERSAFGRRIGLGSGWPGRLFTFAILIVPAPLLFHRPFVLGIIVPFMRFLGAI